MSRKPVIRVSVAVLGGIAVAVSLLGLLMIANAGRGFAGCAATTAFGWTIPLIAGGLVGVASWLLLTGHEGDDIGDDLHSSACAVCGQPIIEEWRLCPYCGTITDRPSTATRTNEQQPVVE